MLGSVSRHGATIELFEPRAICEAFLNRAFIHQNSTSSQPNLTRGAIA